MLDRPARIGNDAFRIMNDADQKTPDMSPRHSAEFGSKRILALDAFLAGRASQLPEPVASELRDWSFTIASRARGALRGLLFPAEAPVWRRALARIGVPIGHSANLVWGKDVIEQPALSLPHITDGTLQLPSLQILESLTSLQLKPVRMFVARMLGCRLQIATNVHFYLWENQSLLVSCASIPLGGFLYGPEPGQRHSLSIAAGGYQLVSW
jgi:hypothetical protein